MAEMKFNIEVRDATVHDGLRISALLSALAKSGLTTDARPRAGVSASAS
jgi:hypothetical protein